MLPNHGSHLPVFVKPCQMLPSLSPTLGRGLIAFASRWYVAVSAQTAGTGVNTGDGQRSEAMSHAAMRHPNCRGMS